VPLVGAGLEELGSLRADEPAASVRLEQFRLSRTQ